MLRAVLAVGRLGGEPKPGSIRHVPAVIGEVRVLVVAVVLADEDHGQLPQLRQVHLLVQEPLPQRAFAEEAHGHAAVLQVLGGIGRARGDAGAPTHDGVGAQVAGAGVGDVHRAALALAVARFLAQQFREHQVGGRPWQAVRGRMVLVTKSSRRSASQTPTRWLFPIKEPSRHRRVCVEIR